MKGFFATIGVIACASAIAIPFAKKDASPVPPETSVDAGETVNVNAHAFTGTKSISGKKYVGLAFADLKKSRVSLHILRVEGEPRFEVVLIDSGFRLWLPDDFLDGRRVKRVGLRSDEMTAPVYCDFSIRNSDGLCFDMPREAVRKLTTGKRLYVQTMDSAQSQLFEFDITGETVQDQLDLMDEVPGARPAWLNAKSKKPEPPAEPVVALGPAVAAGPRPRVQAFDPAANIRGGFGSGLAASHSQPQPEPEPARVSPGQKMRQEAAAAASSWAWKGRGYPTMRTVDARAAAEARQIGYTGEDFSRFREMFREEAILKFTGRRTGSLEGRGPFGR